MRLHVVINTARAYDAALTHLLRSLRMGGGPPPDCRLVAVVTGVPGEEAAAAAADVRGRHPELHVVLTHPGNLWEYTAFLAVGRALRGGHEALLDGDGLFLMLHDTCEAGPRFWPAVGETRDRIAAQAAAQRAASGGDAERERAVEVVQSQERGAAGAARLEVPPEMPDGLFIVDKRSGKRYTARGERLVMRPPLRSPLPGVLFRQQLFELAEPEGEREGAGTTVRSLADPALRLALDPDTGDFCLSGDPARWMRFPHARVDAVADQLEARVRDRETLDWFPVCDNYNIGFATGAFLRQVCADVFAGVTMDKTMAIAIETQPCHPLSLKRNARAWAYADAKRRHHLCNHTNDTDVYGTGVLRAVSYLGSLDVKKFLCFWHPRGPAHPNAV
jgi:hypothetical protein